LKVKQREVVGNEDDDTDEELLKQVIMPGGFKCARSFVWHVQATIREVSQIY